MLVLIINVETLLRIVTAIVVSYIGPTIIAMATAHIHYEQMFQLIIPTHRASPILRWLKLFQMMVVMIILKLVLRLKLVYQAWSHFLLHNMMM